MRLPMLHAAMLAGDLDEIAARAYCEATRDLPDDLARPVCERVLADQRVKTAAQIRDEVHRVAIAADPDLVEKLYAAAVEKRNLTATRHRDGSISITASNLAADDAAGSMGGVERLVREARRAGDPRTVEHLRTAVAAGLLSRLYVTLTDAEILAHLAATRSYAGTDTHNADGADGADAAEAAEAVGGNHSAEERLNRRVASGEPGDDAGGTGDTGDDGQPDDGPDPRGRGGPGGPSGPGTSGPGPAPAVRHPGHGIGLRVELATLLNGNDHPGNRTGDGPIGAARRWPGT